VPFLAAIAIFGVGLVLAGLATSMWVFIVARAIQGFGGGMNIVALYVVAGRAYEPSMRPRLFSVMSTAWVVPAIVGPFLSGVVADEISWRWVFLAVPPLVVPAVLLMLPRLLSLPTVAPESAVTRRTGLAVGTALGMALLQYAGVRLDLVAVALVGVALALLVPTVPKLLPRGTLRAAGGLPTAILLRGVLAGSFFGAETFVPLMLIEERGLATSVAGLTLTGAALSWSVGSWLQGRPSNRIARHRLIQWGTGLVGVAVATVSLTLWHALPPGVAAVSWAIGGLGMGLAMSSVNVVMLDLSPTSEQGFNSAALQVSDALGSIVFIGSAGAVFSQLHDGGASSVTPFLIIFGVFAMIAFIGAWLAPRAARRS
jgi:MFS family permease